ncbi:hypothetical protein ACYKAG_27950, partial [Klebsiella pneumoniae]
VMGRSLSLHREWVRATWRRVFRAKKKKTNPGQAPPDPGGALSREQK